MKSKKSFLVSCIYLSRPFKSIISNDIASDEREMRNFNYQNHGIIEVKENIQKEDCMKRVL